MGMGNILRPAKKGETAYVAGKINGLKDYKKYFKEAETKLKEAGYIVLNPAELPEGMPYNKYLPICTAMLEAADVVYMLSNWEISKGATAEHYYAEAQSKEIIYE